MLISINPIKSDIISTYYVVQLSKVLKFDVSENIVKYLNNYKEGRDHPYYWKLMIEFNRDAIQNSDISDIESLFLKAVKTYSVDSDINKLIEVYSYLEILEELNIPLQSDIKEKLTFTAEKAIQKTTKNNDYLSVQTKSYNSLILYKIDDKNNSAIIKHSDFLIKNIQNFNDLDQGQLECLYFSLVSLSKTEPDKYQSIIQSEDNVKSISNILKAHYVDDGMFSYTSHKDNVDLRSVYYGVWVYENVINNNIFIKNSLNKKYKN
ncbi:hypothetical protein [Paenibacillus caui]|uniref:hypothetical protein n=1 Tax=Paenibacillus caui TaxID=2873927 RepID=UPI001CA93918|nr:hypothetical protein [Paenibacillus caui]